MSALTFQVISGEATTVLSTAEVVIGLGTPESTAVTNGWSPCLSKIDASTLVAESLMRTSYYPETSLNGET
jgi:hypothetical protein